jgi:RecA/RadA recombinase
MPAAKTKAKAGKGERTDTVKVARTPHDRIVDDIRKEYGDVIISGSELVAQRKVLVPIGPAIDFAHNGGWQEGTFVVLSGPPRCGKTTTAIHAAGKAQRPEYGGFRTVYANAEARLEPRDLGAHAGILTDPEHFTIIQSSPPQEDDDGNIVSPGKILTAKDFLGIVEKFLLNTVRRFVIIDSISAMVGESEWNDGLGYGVIAESQRLFAQFMRRMSQVIATNRHIVVGVVHLYSNAGGGPGPKWLEKMSNSAQYGLATKFRSTHFEPWTVGTDKTVIGQIGH